MRETVSYTLVRELPQITISSLSEKIGCTWKEGVVWDQPLIQRFYQLMKDHGRPFIAVDVGAQTGCFTLLSKFFPESQWVAFEPILEAASVLQKNLRLNDIHNVSVYPVAVSHNSNKAVLSMPGMQAWGVSTLGSTKLHFAKASEREVECITLDRFQQMQHLGKVDFLKIDAEGWELNVLRGAEQLIARDRPIILMEYNETNIQQCSLKKEDVLQWLDLAHYRYSMVTVEDILCIPNEL